MDIAELAGSPHQLAVLSIDVDEESVVLENNRPIVLQVELARCGRSPPEHDIARFIIALLFLADGSIFHVAIENLIAFGREHFSLCENNFVGPLRGRQLNVGCFIAKPNHRHGKRWTFRFVLRVGDVDDVPNGMM